MPVTKRKSVADDDELGPNDQATSKKSRLVKASEIREDEQSQLAQGARRSRRSSQIEEDVLEESNNSGLDEGQSLHKTPTKKADGRRRENAVTPKRGLSRKHSADTPTGKLTVDESGTSKIQLNANRSARRKSTRKMIERVVLGFTGDNDEDEDEDELANQIYRSEEDEEEEQEHYEVADKDAIQDTPSKRKRGRPKGVKNVQRSPSPIAEDLPPHEKYFVQNRPGRAKTSNNTLANLKLLDHEEYFELRRTMKDPHSKEIAELSAKYEKFFSQWRFEISQDFNLCIYGFGSKRSLLLRFAEYVYRSYADAANAKVVVVNGYVSTLTIRDVFNTIALTVAEPGVKLGAQPAEMLERLLSLIEGAPGQEITLFIHSIDSTPLCKPSTQALLARLSAHPQVRLIASADHPSFPLLWDSSLRSTFNFLFHECTTFKPYEAEVNVVDKVHELLGRSGRRVGGKDGVIFVLKSLPVNATNLFKILITEQLATSGERAVQVEDNSDAEEEVRHERPRKVEEGVEYRALYQKAVEEFICSNDMGFRSLLKEFHDHQMVQRKKDLLGTEYLVVPFRKEELESILEDIST